MFLLSFCIDKLFVAKFSFNCPLESPSFLLKELLIAAAPLVNGKSLRPDAGDQVVKFG